MIKKTLMRVFALLSAIILFSSCGTNTSISTDNSTPEPTATPSAPPRRGPSAVFPASYPPWTPTPTPTPAPVTPTPKPELEWERVKKMLTFSFEPYIEPCPKTAKDFSFQWEYEYYLRDYCEKKYKENMEYVQSTDFDTLYILMVNKDCYYSLFDEPVCIAIKNRKMISEWKQNIAALQPQTNDRFALSGPFLCGGSSYLDFFIEKGGKITRMFITDYQNNFGTDYGEDTVRVFGGIPYATKIGVNEPDYIDDLFDSLYEYAETEVYKNYASGHPVNLVIE